MIGKLKYEFATHYREVASNEPLSKFYVHVVSDQI